MQIYRYLLLLAILFAALLFIKAPVILLPAVIFVSFPLVWFPGIIVIAKDEVATYMFITKEAITIAEPISAYLRLYFKAIQPTVCIKYFLSTITSHYASCFDIRRTRSNRIIISFQL